MLGNLACGKIKIFDSFDLECIGRVPRTRHVLSKIQQTYHVRVHAVCMCTASAIIIEGQTMELALCIVCVPFYRMAKLPTMHAMGYGYGVLSSTDAACWLTGVGSGTDTILYYNNIFLKLG